MKAQAYLIAYPPQGDVMEYRTTNYEEVYKFKAICKQNNISFSVHFRKPPAERMEYIQSPWQRLKSIFS